MANVFTPGDIVVSVYGDGAGDGTYADNQASPIVLEQINPTTGAIDPITGTIANGTLLANGTLELPQSSAGSDSAISGEYGSSSEGTLELSADGQSLTIAGYGVNDVTYNNGEAGLSPANKQAGGTYGNAALAQSTSVPGGTYPAVARVIADIDANGTVDTSTALFNVDDQNNPRSVVTVDGSSFYLSGQGVKGDSTQGLFYAADGATSATAINTATDVYVSTDAKQVPSGSTAKSTDNISVYNGEPTSAATPSVLPGISQTITLTAAQQNGINNGSVNKSTYLSPENYFFANSTTLYVAD